MLGPQDMKNIAQMMDPEMETVSDIVQVDIEHLDYGYVAKCTDKHELYQLLDYLKSGKEGWFPDLEVAMMKRIESLDSSVRLLPQTPQEINKAKQEIDEELSSWLEQVSVQDESLKVEKKDSNDIAEPIETKFISTDSVEKAMKPNPNRIKGTDYRSWDKFDPESESESTINKTIVNQKKQLEIPQGLSTQERQKLAEFEKIKGNDCMRANEYDQAHEYYSFAIQLHPSAAVYNNRALANLKLTQYSDSVDDCTKALGFERSFKALLRRSTGYFYLGRYQDAVQDVDSCLELEPKSKEAIDLRVKITEKWKEVDGSRFATKKKSKLNIVEVEEWNGPIITEIEENKIVFEDVEDEDSSDED